MPPAKWQIAQMCFKAGAHLPKRKRKMWEQWVEPIANNYSDQYWHRPKAGLSFTSYTTLHQSMIPFGKWHNRFYVSAPPCGNLRPEEYRFYLGHPVSVSQFSQCRVCLKVCSSIEERTKHQKEQGCCAFLSAAIKKVRQFGMCLVCSALTPNEKWGLPLCEQNSLCVPLWQFEVCQPLALRTILLDVSAPKVKVCSEYEKP